MRRKTHQTARLTLRPLRQCDYSTWVKAYAGGLKQQNEWDQGPLTKNKCTHRVFTQFLLRHRRLAREDRCYIYGVFRRSTRVGMIDIAIYERGSLQFANLGYRLFNRYWGQGLAGEAVGAAITIGHRDLKLQRLEASIDLHNKRSIKLVKKLGLEREGIKRAYWFQNGGWDDQVIYVARAK